MAAVVEPQVSIRPMRREDVGGVFAIEQASYPFPWTRGVFADCLRVGYCCRVADVDGDVCGYMIVSAAAGEAHLLNLAVAPSVRGQGVGRLLLDAALVEARLLRAERMFLEVRPSNERAVDLYRRNGFRVIGKRPGYYPAEGGREDAMVLVRHLDDARGAASTAAEDSA